MLLVLPVRQRVFCYNYASMMAVRPADILTVSTIKCRLEIAEYTSKL